jgi:hypothetical protein
MLSAVISIYGKIVFVAFVTVVDICAFVLC